MISKPNGGYLLAMLACAAALISAHAHNRSVFAAKHRPRSSIQQIISDLNWQRLTNGHIA
jgi:hypothetical protein